MRGAQLCEVPSNGRCPVMGGVQLCEVSSYGRCRVMGSLQTGSPYGFFAFE